MYRADIQTMSERYRHVSAIPVGREMVLSGVPSAIWRLASIQLADSKLRGRTAQASYEHNFHVRRVSEQPCISASLVSVFSSGELDPWSGSSITEKSLQGADPSLIVISIPNAAHHYDLRASNPLDTPEVIEARNRVKVTIKGWIQAAAQPIPASAGNGFDLKVTTKVGMKGYTQVLILKRCLFNRVQRSNTKKCDSKV